MSTGVVTLTGIETALLNVGRAVVTPFFTRWLSGRKQTRERTLPLSELLHQKAADEFSRRRGERQIESVVDEVAERLAPLLTTRFAALPPNEAIAALDAVADTFRRADLSDEALFAADIEPARLAAHLRTNAPPAALSDLGRRLYDLALDDCSHCFTQFVQRAAPFANRASVEMLSRLTDLTEMMSTVLHQLAIAGLSTIEFLPRYAEVLTNKLNVLELVGVETQFRPRTELSVAYISLSVTGEGTTRTLSPIWDPSLIRHARPDGAGAERVEQALAKRTRTLIRGDAGAGKSTLLRWLAVTAARQAFTGSLAEWNGRVPFLIKLRSWSAALPRPEQFLTGVADPITGTMPAGWVHRQLDEGRALLLVDGVDELPVERRPRVRAWLKELLDTYPSSLVVVTSRPPAAPVRWLDAEGFESLTLERLSSADVRALIDQWHRAARTSPSLPCPSHELARYEQALLTQLAANRHLYRLAGNPLLAAMLCALNLDRETHLPPDRMGIYQAAVDMLLQRRDTERGVPSTMPAMTARERLQLLQDLAWRLSLNGKSELTRTDAEDFLTRRLAGMPRVEAPAADVLTHLIERSGILREPAAGRIDFVHRTFQEYLAAREAAEQNMGGMLATQAHLDTWREIIIMAAGHGNGPMRTELIERILHRADREPPHRRTLVLLAAACLETLPSLEPPELLTAINRRLDGLLPPRSRGESRSLSAVGAPLLRRLPVDPAALTEAQACAVIRTAALVNGAGAVGFLARFAQDARPKVQRELIAAWEYFPPEEYAGAVLAEAPLDDGRVSLREPRLLAPTKLLRNLRELELEFGIKAELADLPGSTKVTSIISTGGLPGSPDGLQRFPNIKYLHIEDPNRETTAAGIRALRRLPHLVSIALFPSRGLNAEEIAEIGQLTNLTDVYLRVAREIGDLSPLSALSSLTSAAFHGGRIESFAPLALPHFDLLGLGAMQVSLGGVADDIPRLGTLRLQNGCRADDLAVLVRLADLHRLSLFDNICERLGEVIVSPALRTMRLSHANSVDLAPIVAFEGLTELQLSWIREPVDLSQLATWSGGRLTVQLYGSQRAIGRKALPDTVRVRRVDF
ncbi:NACHT domain-containing protein [Actinoplanes sp. NPDC026619]|uniref:NACHT domain-containing protein n=1 Tax=Actinoplanes sp. NPDC026619 TaxID=3155798 RepID=UPI00340190AC